MKYNIGEMIDNRIRDIETALWVWDLEGGGDTTLLPSIHQIVLVEKSIREAKLRCNSGSLDYFAEFECRLHFCREGLIRRKALAN